MTDVLGLIGHDKVECQICKAQMTFLNNKHLGGKHNITTAEYQKKFPGYAIMSEKVAQEKIAHATRINAPRKGINRTAEICANIRTGVKKSFENGRVAHSITPETREAMNDGLRAAYAEGRISGPTKGKSPSAETRAKISAALTGVEQGPGRWLKAQATKAAKGIPLMPTFSGQHHDSDSKQILSVKAQERHSENREIIRQPMIARIVESNLTLLNNICDDVFELRCNKCGLEFTRTSQCFQPSKWNVEVCDQCYPYSKSSEGERSLKEFIETIISGEKIISPNMEVIKPLEIDIHIPSRNLAFEYNGLYWHSENAGKNSNYHRLKYDKCGRVGLRLVSVMEDEWLLHRTRTEGLIASILSCEKFNTLNWALLDLSDNKPVYDEFFNSYHFNGTSKNISQCFGLYNGSELVYCLGWSVSDENVITIRRQIHRHGTWSQDSFSTIIESIVTLYKQGTIVGYTDNRWEIGVEFIDMEFTVEDIFTTCWYLAANYLKRMSCPSSTTTNKIWDCGRKKWTLKFSERLKV